MKQKQLQSKEGVQKSQKQKERLAINQKRVERQKN